MATCRELKGTFVLAVLAEAIGREQVTLQTALSEVHGELGQQSARRELSWDSKDQG